MENISKHITYEAATRSYTAKRKGIDNTPNIVQLEAMVLVAQNVYERLVAHFGIEIVISSFFRSKKLNTAVGGAKGSQHMALNGAAIDLDGDATKGNITNQVIFDYIKDNLEFDQLIHEHVNADGTGGWIHVSYKKTGNRKQIIYV